MKVPWLSRAVLYRKINCLWFEAVSEIEIVIIREVENDLSIENVRKKCISIQSFLQKLKIIPFIILDDNEAVNSQQTFEWKPDDHTILESTIKIEDLCVHLNFFSIIDNYVEKNCQTSSFFCRSMCLPKFITKQDVVNLQNQRLNIIDKQIADWRILSRSNESCVIMRAIDMTTTSCL